MVESSFNWVDCAIIAVIILSVLISLVRGFVREALSLVTWIGAVWVGIHYYSQVSFWLEPHIASTPIRMGSAFFILFVITLLFGSIISFILVKFIHKTGLSGTDRTLGAVFGLLRGGVVVSIALLMMQLMFPAGSSSEAEALTHSRLALEFSPMISWLKEFLPEAPESAKIMQMSGLPG
jgi:membrane protein required for colicin V production